MVSEPQAFIKEALTAGHSKQEIRSILAAAGWPEDEVDEALARYADVDFPVPVPTRRPSSWARETLSFTS